MGFSTRPIIANCRVFPKGNTSRHNLRMLIETYRSLYDFAHLVGQSFKMATHEIVAIGVEKDEEA
jgi:hypothetical protein